MNYVLKITQISTGAFVGYVHVPRRSAKKLEFTTLQLKHAQQIDGCDRAHQRAMRYNSMNVENDLQVHVVSLTAEQAAAQQEADNNEKHVRFMPTGERVEYDDADDASEHFMHFMNGGY